jgi:hypothetical protein
VYLNKYTKLIGDEIFNIFCMCNIPARLQLNLDITDKDTGIDPIITSFMPTYPWMAST